MWHYCSENMCAMGGGGPFSPFLAMQMVLCKWHHGIGPFVYFFLICLFFRKREKSVSSRHPHGIRYWSRGLILTLTAAFILDNHGYLWSSLYLMIVSFYERVKQILGVLILSFPTHKRTQHGNYFQNLARNQLELFKLLSPCIGLRSKPRGSVATNILFDKVIHGDSIFHHKTGSGSKSSSPRRNLEVSDDLLQVLVELG